eukprot:TRINITY_DN15818_c0_g1_i1.p1 TRINITY_DN15818_c0_g1~~TRINITY_DN15818_c0_g1_i1.p1  ORF type:complete len:127 (-),score=10.22 TRINITY_DN15818_c0_g1_i1:530-859(-)
MARRPSLLSCLMLAVMPLPAPASEAAQNAAVFGRATEEQSQGFRQMRATDWAMLSMTGPTAAPTSAPSYSPIAAPTSAPTSTPFLVPKAGPTSAPTTELMSETTQTSQQ